MFRLVFGIALLVVGFALSLGAQSEEDMTLLVTKASVGVLSVIIAILVLKSIGEEDQSAVLAKSEFYLLPPKAQEEALEIISTVEDEYELLRKLDVDTRFREAIGNTNYDDLPDEIGVVIGYYTSIFGKTHQH